MRYVILADIHANYAALKAIERAVGEWRHSGEVQYWFLGDLLGYGPTRQAIDCIHWLRFQSRICNRECDDSQRRWVPGNHDEWIVKQLGRVRKEGAVTLLAQREELEHKQQEDWQWFEQQVLQVLQTEQHSLLTESCGGSETDLCLAFTHAGVSIDERRGTYMFPWNHSTLRGHFDLLLHQTDAQTVCLFHGHTHLPFLARIEDGKIACCSIQYGEPISLQKGHFLINPGSAGHPRDGDPRAAFVSFDPETREIEFHRVSYNARQVVDELRLQKGNHISTHRKAALYLIALDAQKLSQERGIEIDPQKPSKRLLREYLEEVDQAYDRLIHELETGDGGEEMQRYHAEVYRTPRWDLEAICSQPK